jgi:hypothetical protein
VHLHLNHVIVKQLQFQNVEMDQPAVWPDAETTKLQHVLKDVILKTHLQTHVIVNHNL